MRHYRTFSTFWRMLSIALALTFDNGNAIAIPANEDDDAPCQLLAEAGLPANTGNEAAESGPAVLYQKAFNAICKYDLQVLLLDQNSRSAWLRRWQHYAGAVTTEGGVDDAVNAMVDSLRLVYPGERFTSYQLPEANAGEIAKFNPARVGIGAAIDFEGRRDALGRPMSSTPGVAVTASVDRPVVIVGPPDQGGPAEREGIVDGDQILEIDGESVNDKPLKLIGAKILGYENTPVTLKIKHIDQNSQVTVREVTMMRSRIIQPVIHPSDLENNILRVRQSDFASNDATDEMRAALGRLSARRVLILDFRNNLGGLLNYALEEVESILPSGTVIVTRRREGDQLMTEIVTLEPDAKVVTTTRGSAPPESKRMKRQPLLVPPNVPIVVLVDNSLSAAEDVAEILQANKRAVIVGKRTLGKGRGQRFTPLPGNRNLHITNSELLPGGLEIDQIGVNPDIVVEKGDDPGIDAQLEAARIKALELLSRHQVDLQQEPSP